ncbi:hypothetical protein EUGRSUZ_D01234 [Eucalyptus grandis]|uniref:PGG domain-containing protein n=2 Tax=Eucalyptus grandis TaxID=71139 RepID=A0A059CET8_EUCGR|nr:hypothetical protein EUGRSUZ_D01234 [Eucalyptus grandis]
MRMHHRLYEAAKSGDFDRLKIISEDEEDLFHRTTPKDNSILHVAAQYKQENFIQRLLRCPSGPSLLWQVNCKGDTPLHVAAKVGSYEWFESSLIWLSHCIGSLKKDELRHAKSYFESWWKILEKRPEVIREGDDMGWTPLHYVSCIGKVKEVQLLLQHDTSVAYDLDKEGQSAFHIAAFQGHVDVIDELVKSCPDACDIINTEGQTALHAAAIGGQVNAVKYILGTPNLEDLVNEQDIGGNTALHLAALHKQYNIIYILQRDKRVDLLATNKDHMTALDIFSAHKEGGYQAAKVYHLLKGSDGMPFYQDWVIEYVKKRLDKQNVEGQPAASIITGSNIANPENIDSSKRSIIDLQLLVALLIATVSFTAAVTMPGGYNQDGPNQGMAILAGRAAFKAFVISNTTAFGFSILALYLQFDTVTKSDRLRVRYAKVASYSMYVAILAMVLAFATGTYLVLSKNTGLRIVPFVVSGCLATMYVIGGFLDPEAPFWWLSSSPRQYVRNLLFDYGIL